MSRSDERRAASLRRLARLNGVMTEYLDDRGRRQQASPEALRLVIEALRPGLLDGGERAAIHELRNSRWHWDCDPVAVAWNGRFGQGDLRLPAGASGRIDFHLEREDGETFEWSGDVEALPPRRSHDIEGVAHLARGYRVDHPLPPGYHRLRMKGSGFEREVMVISAPRRAYERRGGNRWGAFLPLYALHSQNSWGAGDFSDLAAFNDWVLDSGGDLVATLPLLPAYMGEPYDPSPYSPVSRLFWNEFYVDPRSAASYAECPEAREIVDSAAFKDEVARLQQLPFVDYRAQMQIKRDVMTRLARHAFEQGETAALASFLEARPDVAEYARFRVERETQGVPWSQWPADALRPGEQDGIAGSDAYRFYVYSQYLAEQQLDGIARRSRERGGEIYLDLPLGCHPDGYDSWRYRESYVKGVASGAPPDTLFTGGQNWGFAPLHPHTIRDNGYQLFRSVIRHHLRFANVLRIDHVMGLHRLYWVPTELPATQGVYVQYNAPELYAILNLESHRAQATIMGENLGTVPRRVNESLDRHHIYKSYVMQYELAPEPGRPPSEPPERSFASLNTHDMPPFNGFLTGRDIELRRALGMTPPELAEQETRERVAQRSALIHTLREAGLLHDGEPTPEELYRAAIAYLARSRARYMLINVEDLWQETEPQNVPGTNASTPNWSRRSQQPLEQFQQP